MRILGVIPARLESSRLPRKPLREICGKPMIVWVYERARQAKCLGRVMVATDSQEVLAVCGKSGIPSVLTSPEHRSGTDRLVEVMAREPADVYVNIQGDEPMVTAAHIELLVDPFERHPETQVSTLKVRVGAEEAGNPNVVKVVADREDGALYFSRARIPCDRDSAGRARYFKHLGLYAYRAEALRRFSKLKPSELEQTEKLEQLRFLENGIPIAVVETTQDTIGVDTEEDLKRVEEYFRKQI
jgi:3-deoxy-manno-octulosonate cytidylyltransferase (CMP-KDO synthetase)